MARVITDQLHQKIGNILESLLDKAPKSSKGELAKIFGEFSEADVPKGYMD